MVGDVETLVEEDLEMTAGVVLVLEVLVEVEGV